MNATFWTKYLINPRKVLEQPCKMWIKLFYEDLHNLFIRWENNPTQKRTSNRIAVKTAKVKLLQLGSKSVRKQGARSSQP